VLIVKEFDGFFDIAVKPMFRGCVYFADLADPMAEQGKDGKGAEFADRDGFAASNDSPGAWR
jgi:hypothetical protein